MPRVSRGKKLSRLTHPKPLVLLILHVVLYVACVLAIIMISVAFAGDAARTAVTASTTVYLDVPNANCTCSAAEEAARLLEVERFMRQLQNSSSAFVATVYTEAGGDFTSADCHVDHENETVSTWTTPQATVTLRCSIAENSELTSSSIMEVIEVETDVYRELDGYRTQDGVRHKSEHVPLYIRIAAACSQFVVLALAFGFGWAQWVHYHHLWNLRRPPRRGCRTVQRAVAVQPAWHAGRRVFPEYEMQDAPYGRGYYVDPSKAEVRESAEAARPVAKEEPIRRSDDSEVPTRTVSQLTKTNDPAVPAESAAATATTTSKMDSARKRRKLGVVTAEEIENALEEEEDSGWDDREVHEGGGDQPQRRERPVLPPVLSADFIDFDDFDDDAENQPGITLECVEEDGTTRQMLTEEMIVLRAAHRRRAKVVFAIALVLAFACIALPIVSAVIVIATSVTGGSEDASLHTANHLKTSHGALTIVGCIFSGIAVATIILILSRRMY